MSNTVEKTVESINLLIAGGDLSDSVHLRQLHKACLQAFKELNSNLEQCRALVENGSLQAARELNLSFDPSLTRQAELLACFKGNDFFAVCKEYGLETPVFPDEQLLKQLNAPISSGEKHLHALLQDYRKIARSGTMLQRITLLRRIVQKLPKSTRWRNDLISAERSRLQEMEHEFEQLAGDPECCRRLEELYREAMAPEWLVPPKEEFKAAVRQKLLPLQQARLNREAETRLAQLQECWMARDIPRLEKEFEKWKIFCSNPVLKLTSEQKQTAADIGTFLEHEAESRENDRICQELIRKIEQQLADNAPFSDVTGNYNQLQLMDCPIPTALADRMKALEEEYNRLEHLRHVRWCLFGICGAVLLILGIAFSVQYMQHYLAVQRSLADMQDLLDKKRYDEVIKIYEGLSVSSAEVAADPQIIKLHAAAVKTKDEIIKQLQRQENEFSRLLERIEQLAGKDVLDNAEALSRAIAEAEKIKGEALKKELLDRFARLKTQVTQRRTEQKKQREAEFLALCRKKVAEVDQLTAQITDPQKKLEDLKTLLAVSEKDLDSRMDSSRYIHIGSAMKDDEKKQYQSAKMRFELAWEKEKASRLVNFPETFDNYLEALKNIRYKYPDLAALYSSALRLSENWKNERDNYEKKFPEKLESFPADHGFKPGLFKSDLDIYLPQTQRSSRFDKFFSEDIQGLKDLKELVFTAADKRQFYFYFREKDGRIENLRNPRRTNISFVALPVDNEKSSRFIISFHEKDPETPFMVKSAPSNLPYLLPKGFVLLGGQPKPSKNWPLWPGYVLASKYNALNSDGPGLISNLKDALRFICQEGNVENIYLKKELLLQFLQELHDTSAPLYPEMEEELEELRKLPQRNWRAPQMVPEYGTEKKQFDRKWTLLNFERLLAAGDLRDQFICQAHARLLIPVGVIRNTEPDKVKIHLFKDCSIPLEGVVLTNGTVAVLPAEVWQGKIPRDKKWKSLLFPGQVIWRYGDNKSTSEFMREWKEKAQRLNIELKVKPSVLPSDLFL